MTFGTRGLVMWRKRLMASRADGHRWLMAAGWRIAGRQGSAAGVRSGHPFPVPYFAVASPRAHRITASFLDGSLVHLGIGAIERLPRATATGRVLAGSREVFMPHPETEDAWPNRAYGSSGEQQPRQGGRRSTDAPDDGADGPWGDVFFVREDALDGTARNATEGVPCRRSTMGDDETHDIPRGSGGGAFAVPGVFLETPSRRWN